MHTHAPAILRACVPSTVPHGLLQAVKLALEMAGADAATTAFFDDSARNVAAGRASGLYSVLVRLKPSCCLVDEQSRQGRCLHKVHM